MNQVDANRAESRIEGRVAIPNLGVVQHRIAHAGKQVGFLVEGVAQVAVLGCIRR